MTASSSVASDLEMRTLDLEASVAPGPASSVEPRRDLPCLKVARREAIGRFEVEYVRALLQKAGGNVTRAAALADVSRQVIHKLIARHRL